MTREIWFVALFIFLFGLASCRGAMTEPASVIPPNEAPAATTLGFDIRDLSTTVRPQDDFWRYVNGRWLEETDIPADRSSHGTFRIIFDETEAQIRTLVEQAYDGVQNGSAEGSERLVGELYASFMNEAEIETLGTAPLDDLFAKIDGLKSTAELVSFFGEMTALGVTVPTDQYLDNDASNGSRLLLYLYQGGLGLPNRDYYLEDKTQFAAARESYELHIQKMYALAGWKNGAKAAADILMLEHHIAKIHWTQVQNRNREVIYSNKFKFADAQLLAGAFPLDSWFAGFGLAPPENLVVVQTDYFKRIGELVTSTSLQTWKAYLRFHVLSAMAPYLTAELSEENFDFRARKLRGQESQAPRWKRGVRLVNSSIGEELGQRYVAEYFPEQAKAAILELVENLRAAFKTSINQLEWMSGPTKTQAQEKLKKFLPKLGYPDQWRDYSGLSTGPDTLVANVRAARQLNHEYGLQRLSSPVDRGAWIYPPQTVNAFYRPTHNSITFPAGVLQSPLYSPNADQAMNYGAIGSIIGHEFSHGFDDQGRKFDGTGLLRNWWSDEDAKRYKARSNILVDQYKAFSPLADTQINGELTLGENIGDLAGVTMAYKAFELSGFADGPNIAGLSPRQRFFIGFAIAFRGKVREPYLRELLVSDTHSPVEFRVLGVLRNMPEFYEAFEVGSGDGMYLPPGERAKIW